MSEARAHRRYRVWLPIQVTSETTEAALEGMIAVSRDASVGGLLLSSPEPLGVGARVELTLVLPPLDDLPQIERKVQGSIVRIEPNVDDPHGPWPHRVAVRFDEPLTELEPALAGIAEELAKPK